eukprot:scaffold392_cov101-Isochrysis_galbana.AAC.4
MSRRLAICSDMVRVPAASRQKRGPMVRQLQQQNSENPFEKSFYTYTYTPNAYAASCMPHAREAR